MILQIAIMAILTKLCVAWPITPLDGYKRVITQNYMLECGDDKDFREETFELLNITFGGFDSQGKIPANCSIKLRISLKDLGITKYGLDLLGDLDIRGSGCSSSYMTVANEDVLDDPTGTLEKFCGQTHVKFSSQQDILVIEFNVGDTGAQGTGFHFLVKPIYLCGGIMDLEGPIYSPSYPDYYGKELTCLWLIKAPKEYHISMNCDKFELRPLVGKKKVDYMLIKELTTTKEQQQYCGKEIHENTDIIFNTNYLLVEFRSSNKNNNKFIGFSCNMKFTSTTKDLLLAKFFK